MGEKPGDVRQEIIVVFLVGGNFESRVFFDYSEAADFLRKKEGYLIIDKRKISQGGENDGEK